MIKTTLLSLAMANLISAHCAGYHKGMYCLNGNDTSKPDLNSNTAVNPLYQLNKEDWWFQHGRGCDKVPPADGDFLELPANGEFTVEIAHNQAQTTLTNNGAGASDWPDGKNHPDDWNSWTGSPDASCLPDDGAMHAYNQTSAAGTAFAISYNSKLEDVTMENLVVFSVLEHTPWKRLATYQVPDLPECPPEGCHCAWLWIPNGCGQGNMYMHGYKCKVTGASPNARPLAQAQPPAMCQDDPSKCVKGAKQMLAWHQLTGNNIETPDGVSPGYNERCGFASGAQKDIFEGGAAAPAPGGNATSSAISIPSSVPTDLPVSSAVPTSVGVAGTPISELPASSALPTSELMVGTALTELPTSNMPTATYLPNPASVVNHGYSMTTIVSASATPGLPVCNCVVAPCNCPSESSAMILPTITASGNSTAIATASPTASPTMRRICTPWFHKPMRGYGGGRWVTWCRPESANHA